MLNRIACHVSSERVVLNTPRGFLYLSAGVAVIGKVGEHVWRFLQQKKEKVLPKRREYDRMDGRMKSAKIYPRCR